MVHGEVVGLMSGELVMRGILEGDCKDRMADRLLRFVDNGCFAGPDVLPVTQPAVSKHCRSLVALSQPRKITCWRLTSLIPTELSLCRSLTPVPLF